MLDRMETGKSHKNDAIRRLHGTKHCEVRYQKSCFCEKSCVKSDSIVSYKVRATKYYVFLLGNRVFQG